MNNAPLDLNTLTVLVGGAVGVAILTIAVVLFIQRGVDAIMNELRLQRKEIDKILNDHGERIMRLEWSVFGATVEGPHRPPSMNHEQ